MSNTINLVQSDTGPDLTVTLYDAGSNAPIDVSGGSDVIHLYVRLEEQSGVPVVTDIAGVRPNGGADGVVTFIWPTGAIGEPGNYEGEIKVTFTSGKTETVPEKLRFFVREKIA
jgi:hypothetical protein